jgi:hypothetical protein
MYLVPYERFEVETTLTNSTIVEVLSSKIEPKKIFRLSSNHAPFEGDISLDGFEINRIIHYRNSFLPVISGQFHTGVYGTKVIIKMRLHFGVIAFMCVWFVVMGSAFFSSLSSILDNKTAMSVATFIPLGMLIFVYVMVSGGFWFEARKQKKMLIKIFSVLESNSILH